VRKLDRGKEIAMPRKKKVLRAPRRGSEPSRLRRVLRWMIPSRPMDTIAIAVAACATAAVLVNALVLQQRLQQPASVSGEQSKAASEKRQQATAKRTVPAAPAPAINAPFPPQRPDTAPRTRSDLVLDIQRELAQRGYYDGTVDGMSGARTAQAIRDFEQAQGLKPTGEPSEALLARVLQARARREITGSVPARAAEPRPSTRVLAVQRVLARLGYGPLKLTGLPDPATRTAVEQFERDRGMPRTGEIGEKVVSELAVVTGTPVE
jgi:peptidoglycan hydrolase-like protein with peptidoglycan-binding domain